MAKFNDEYLNHLKGSLKCCESLHSYFLDKDKGYVTSMTELSRLFNYDVGEMFASLTYLVIHHDIIEMIFFESWRGECIELKDDKLRDPYFTDNEDKIYINYRRI